MGDKYRRPYTKRGPSGVGNRDHHNPKPMKKVKKKARSNKERMSNKSIEMDETVVKSAKRKKGKYSDDAMQAARNVREKRGQRKDASGKNYGSTGGNSKKTARLDDYITLMAKGNSGKDAPKKKAEAKLANKQKTVPSSPSGKRARNTGRGPSQPTRQTPLRGSGSRTGARATNNQISKRSRPTPHTRAKSTSAGVSSGATAISAGVQAPKAAKATKTRVSKSKSRVKDPGLRNTLGAIGSKAAKTVAPVTKAVSGALSKVPFISHLGKAAGEISTAGSRDKAARTASRLKSRKRKKSKIIKTTKPKKGK